MKLITAVRDFSKGLRLNKHSKEFGYAIEKFLNCFHIHSDTPNQHLQVFQFFKNNFIQLRQAFEENPVYHDNLGWTNLVNLLTQATYDLEEKCFFSPDKILARDIYLLAQKINDVWNKIPSNQQIVLDREGIIFATTQHVMCIDIIEGISQSTNSANMDFYTRENHRKRNEVKSFKPTL